MSVEGELALTVRSGAPPGPAPAQVADPVSVNLSLSKSTTFIPKSTTLFQSRRLHVGCQ